MPWSITIGRVAGTAIRVHITFILFLVWIGASALRQGGQEAAIQNVTFIVLLFACVLLHEFGHIFTALHFGIHTPEVTLLPIGGVASLERIPEKPGQEFAVAIAGPMVNVVIALGLVLAAGAIIPDQLDKIDDPNISLLARLATANIFLAVFNMVPAFPMDGGRMLRSALAVVVGRFFPHYPVPASLIATRIAVRCFAWPVALVMMVYSLQRRDYWLYLLLFPLLLFAAEIEYQTLREANAPQNEGENPGAD